MTEKQIQQIQSWSDFLRSLTIPLVIATLGYFSATVMSLNTQMTVLTTKVAVLENTFQLYLNTLPHNVNYSTGPANVK